MHTSLPPPAFRVAITGMRDLDPDALSRVSAACDSLFEQCKRHLTTAAGLTKAAPARLRLLSPLGEGADRAFAAAGLKMAASPSRDILVSLEVALPFAQSDYEASFGDGALAAESVAEFREMLHSSDDVALELDGTSAPDHVRQRSYEALGQFLVRNCDLLVAVWDEDRPSNGRGGTADTLRFALRTGVPVWWIDPVGGASRWLRDLADLDSNDRLAGPDYLSAYLDRLLLPPPAHEHSAGPAAWVRRVLRVPADPLYVYLAEPAGQDLSIIRIHSWAVGRLRRAGRRYMERHHNERLPPLPRAIAAPEDVAALDVSRPAAALSRRYQNRYRSSYMVVLILGATALVSAAVGSTGERFADIAFWVEISALLGIAGLWLLNEAMAWHRRYLSYRMLAELGRCACFLNAIGRGASLAPLSQAGQQLAGSWNGWLFAAGVRQLPLPRGRFDGERLAALRAWIGRDMFDAQLAFHRVRRMECQGAERLLGWLGTSLFAATLIVVSIKGGLHAMHLFPEIHGPLALLAAVLPILSALVFGIRAYEEFGSLGEQSAQMVLMLQDVAPRLNRIACDAPLASQQIGVEASALATAMLNDSSGWSLLFRGKTIEA